MQKHFLINFNKNTNKVKKKITNKIYKSFLQIQKKPQYY